MEEKSKKQAIILSVVAVVTLIILVVGATYAYFSAQGGSATSTNLNVTTYTTDVFTFAAGDEINLEITQSNFASGKGNAVGNTFASATLTANNKTNTATEHYYLYLNIENNDFEYTVNNTTPELMLTITDSEGNEVTDIAGLTHTTVPDAKGATVSGYDITAKSGLLTIFKNREITTTSKKEEKWNITITFVNLDADQTKNANKSLSAKVMIQKEEIVQTLANICKNGQSLSSCIVAMNGVDDTLYHHDGTIKSTSEFSISFYDNENDKEVVETYPIGTLLDANDGSYRYAGADPNNYVCFGSNESPCPTDNLYRIIGVFGVKVKLIKSDYATSALLGTDGDYCGDIYSKVDFTSYKGKLTSVNTYYNYLGKSMLWSDGWLNKTNLNVNYITNIGEKWANKIDTATWKVGGNSLTNILYSVIPTVVYQNEVVNPLTPLNGETDYISKIGLMYASDYGFAAAPSAWTTTLENYGDEAIKSANWMYMGLQEWTISPNTGGSCCSFYVSEYGSVYGSVRCRHAVRPVFYLKSSVTYISGFGTSSDPIRVN